MSFKALNKKYNVIYCDPPWHYNNIISNGAAANHYPTMKQKDLMAMRPFIDEIADDPCFLLMWATYPLLAESLDLVNAWGFKYKTVAFTWVKKYANGKYSIGGGNYTRSNAEICLLGVRGKNIKVSNDIKNRGINQIIETNDQGRRKHSRKPSEARERIDTLFGDVAKIELFARETVDNWDHWGNEVDKFNN